MEEKLPLTVVIPMAGLGSRFTDYGFKVNKYMLPINIKLETMIEKAITSLDVDTTIYDVNFVFITRHLTKEIHRVLEDTCNCNGYKYNILDLKDLTDGPATTVYVARHLIPPENMLIVSNSDQVLRWNFNSFMEKSKNYSGCILTYNPNYHIEIGKLDKHSFARLDEMGNVVDVTEKIAISNVALVGVHYFKKAQYFFDAYNSMVSMNMRAPNNEFYLSLTYKVMLLNKESVGTYHIDQVSECFHPTGEPQDYFDYLYKYGGYNLEPKAILDNYEFFPNVRYKVFSKGETFANVQSCSCILTGENAGNIYCNQQVYFAEDTKVVIFPYTDQPNGTYNVADFVRGWFVGAFEPTLYHTEEFEIGLLSHKKNEKWDYHYHKGATEYNILISGKMKVNNIEIVENDLFILEKNQISCPIFVEDCKVLCVKTPHVKNDKFVL